MAEYEGLDESEFENPPRAIQPGQLKTAWHNRDAIKAKIAEGKSPHQIVPVFHVPLAAIDWVMARMNAGAATETGRADSAQPDPIRSGGSDPEESRQPAAVSLQAPVTQRPAQQATPAGQTTEQPPPAEPFRPIVPSGPDLMSIGAPIRSPQGGGPFEVPDIYATLLNVCKAWGLKPEEANGVVFTFAYQADPNDVEALRRILVTAGKNRWTVDSIVNTWSTVVQQMGGEGSPVAIPRGPEARMAAMQRRLGLKGTSKPTSDPEEMAIEDLERQEHLLKIQETQLAIQERQKALTARSGGPTPTADDEMVDILLDVNGVPTPRRIRVNQMGMYQPFLMQARPQQPSQPEGPPDWFKPYADKIAVDAEERKLERAKRDQQEALAAAVGPLNDHIKRLEERLTANPAQSDLSKKYDDLMLQLRDQSAKDLQSRLDRMESAIRTTNNPDVALQVIDRERAVAGRMGMVPASSVGALQSEQVALESERDGNKTRNAAQAQLMNVATDRLKDKPVKDLVTTLGIDQVAKGVMRKQFATDEERAGTGVAPTPEEMLDAAQNLEQQAGAGRPPLPPTRPGGQTGPESAAAMGIVVG